LLFGFKTTHAGAGTTVPSVTTFPSLFYAEDIWVAYLSCITNV